MKRVLAVVGLVLLLAVLTTSVVLADSGMPQAPEWQYFWLNVVGSGAIVLLLVNGLIILLPAPYGVWVKQQAAMIVAIGSALCPTLANAVLARWPTVDPVMWTVVYFGLSWAAHQAFYMLQKRKIGQLAPKG